MTDEEVPSGSRSDDLGRHAVGVGIALGAGFGVAVGAILLAVTGDAFWLGMGVAIGSGLGVVLGAVIQGNQHDAADRHAVDDGSSAAS